MWIFENLQLRSLGRLYKVPCSASPPALSAEDSVAHYTAKLYTNELFLCENPIIKQKCKKLAVCIKLAPELAAGGGGDAEHKTLYRRPNASAGG